MCLVLTKSLLFWRKLSEVSRGLSFFLPANGSRIQFQSENLCWKKYWYCLGSFSARAGQESGEGSLAIQYRCPCIELICKKRSVSIYLFWDLSVICSLFSPYSTPSTPSCYKHPFYSAFSSVPSLLLRVRKQHGALRVAGKPTGQEANTWAEVRSYHNGETFALKGQSAIHPGQFNNRDRGLVFSSCFPKENYLFLLSEIYVFSLTAEGFIRHPCSCQKNQLDYWACSSFFLPLFTSYSEELVCSPCLCCPTWWGIALHSPKHCPYSLWWLLILNFGAHGAPCAACMHPNNHTLVSHWNLAAVGLVVSSPLPGDQQSPAQPRDVGPRSLSVPGLAHPVSPMCRTGLCCPFHYHRQSCCSLIPWQSPWIPSVPGGCWLQKRFRCHPAPR